MPKPDGGVIILNHFQHLFKLYRGIDGCETQSCFNRLRLGIFLHLNSNLRPCQESWAKVFKGHVKEKISETADWKSTKAIHIMKEHMHTLEAMCINSL